ncbi:MAG: D-aminoacyl-tRNA deacylase [Ignisphaera sp.]
MDTIIAYYVDDPAGRGIIKYIIDFAKCLEDSTLNSNTKELKERYICRNDNISLLGFSIDVIYLEVLNNFSSAEYYVIVSRHSAKSGKPSLTTHTPGNPWGRSDFGGRPWEIPPSNPILMWYIIKGLNKYSIEFGLENKYEVCYEVTHHGPTSINKPVTFVELGSSEKEWTNTNAQEAIAMAILEAIKEFRTRRTENECTISVGFGGSHYAPIFTKRAFEENECYGHMIPNYVIKELKLEELKFIARKAIELTPGSKRIVIEKMRKEMREIIEEEADRRNLEIVRY